MFDFPHLCLLVSEVAVKLFFYFATCWDTMGNFSCLHPTTLTSYEFRERFLFLSKKIHLCPDFHLLPSHKKLIQLPAFSFSPAFYIVSNFSTVILIENFHKIHRLKKKYGEQFSKILIAKFRWRIHIQVLIMLFLQLFSIFEKILKFRV